MSFFCLTEQKTPNISSVSFLTSSVFLKQSSITMLYKLICKCVHLFHVCQPCGKKVAILFCVDVIVASGSQPGAWGPLGGLSKLPGAMKVK